MPAILRAVAALLFSLLIFSPAAAQSPGTGANAEPGTGGEASLIIFNRPIFTFRGHFLGAAPATRMHRASVLIDEAIRQGGDLSVNIKANTEGHLITLGSVLAFVVTADDIAPLSGQSEEDLAKSAARNLEQVIAESREARNIHALLKALASSVAATVVFGFLLWGLRKLRLWLEKNFLDIAKDKAAAIKIGTTRLIEEKHLLATVQRLFDLLRWLAITLLCYEWTSFVLSRFPYTRAWGERLNDYLISVASSVLGGIAGAIPGLGVALAIFFLARFSTRFLGAILKRMSKADTLPNWLAPDTLPTTRRLFNIAIWLFAIAMAYPYLPGAQTEAFRGLSVLLGIMVSLGASSIVGQGAAGLILTYTRSIRPGEFVRIGDHEGTVTHMGLFTTTIRTGLGEELTIPNALITGGVAKNYSRAVEGRGFVVDTTVTIGYDTPWRQVEAMLIEAARRTPGILKTPVPRVFQTALADYYPEYRLVAQAIPGEPSPRAEVLSTLHANIQDVFNEYGVQIMSPHYMADTETAKLVPPENWYPAPAKKSGNSQIAGNE